MPAVVNVMKDDAMLITLIKPQFEAHRSQVCGSPVYPSLIVSMLPVLIAFVKIIILGKAMGM